MRDFTLDMYGRLISELKLNKFEFFRFADQPFLHTPETRHVILRHDVDRMPSRALKMADLEFSMGVHSTYFFRTKTVSFNRKIISRILSMGHEIGYHYECLSDTRGDITNAWKLFNNELKKFKAFCEIKSIAMHGRPLLPYDNRDLWKHHDYREAGIELEAYKDIPWDKYVYFTDVGGCWNSEYNLRDYVSHERTYEFVTTTEQLIMQLGAIKDDMIISTHPERWPASIPGWLQARTSDFAVNHVKRVIKAIYK